MRERFEQQMEILHTELIELGALCEQAIGRTYEVLLEGNQRAAEEIIKKDQVVDAKEREIEDLCFRIILQQQPVARDLRQVSAALKMITDMERIGDQAADIADIVKVTSLDVPDASIRLKDMAKATASMVTKCIDAYVKQDLNLHGRLSIPMISWMIFLMRSRMKFCRVCERELPQMSSLWTI